MTSRFVCFFAVYANECIFCNSSGSWGQSAGWPEQYPSCSANKAWKQPHLVPTEAKALGSASFKSPVLPPKSKRQIHKYTILKPTKHDIECAWGSGSYQQVLDWVSDAGSFGHFRNSEISLMIAGAKVQCWSWWFSKHTFSAGGDLSFAPPGQGHALSISSSYRGTPSSLRCHQRRDASEDSHLVKTPAPHKVILFSEMSWNFIFFVCYICFTLLNFLSFALGFWSPWGNDSWAGCLEKLVQQLQTSRRQTGQQGRPGTALWFAWRCAAIWPSKLRTASAGKWLSDLRQSGNQGTWLQHCDDLRRSDQFLLSVGAFSTFLAFCAWFVRCSSSDCQSKLQMQGTRCTRIKVTSGGHWRRPLNFCSKVSTAKASGRAVDWKGQGRQGLPPSVAV